MSLLDEMFKKAFESFLSFSPYKARVNIPYKKLPTRAIFDEIKEEQIYGRPAFVWISGVIYYTSNEYVSEKIAVIERSYKDPHQASITIYARNNKMLLERANMILRHLERYFNTKINLEFRARYRGGRIDHTYIYDQKTGETYRIHDLYVDVNFKTKTLNVEPPESLAPFKTLYFRDHKKLHRLKQKYDEAERKTFQLNNLYHTFLLKIDSVIDRIIREISKYDLSQIADNVDKITFRMIDIREKIIDRYGVYAKYSPEYVEKLLSEHIRETDELIERIKELMPLATRLVEST
jgi:hypothetical protein